MGKVWDVLFLALIIAFIIPDGRNMLRRAILSTGVIGNVEANANEQLSFESQAFTLQDLNGNQVQMADLEGQVVFLNFWATWCGPCKAEMPSIESVYKDMGEEVVFLCVSYEEPEVISKFMNREGYDLPVYFPVNAIPQQLAAEALPTTLIINSEGQIVHRSKGMANWNTDKARELLRSAQPKS